MSKQRQGATFEGGVTTGRDLAGNDQYTTTFGDGAQNIVVGKENQQTITQQTSQAPELSLDAYLHGGGQVCLRYDRERQLYIAVRYSLDSLPHPITAPTLRSLLAAIDSHN